MNIGLMYSYYMSHCVSNRMMIFLYLPYSKVANYYSTGAASAKPVMRM